MRSFVFWLAVGGGFVGLGGSAETEPNGTPSAAPASQPTASAPASQRPAAGNCPPYRMDRLAG